MESDKDLIAYIAVPRCPMLVSLRFPTVLLSLDVLFRVKETVAALAKVWRDMEYEIFRADDTSKVADAIGGVLSSLPKHR